MKRRTQEIIVIAAGTAIYLAWWLYAGGLENGVKPFLFSGWC